MKRAGVLWVLLLYGAMYLTAVEQELRGDVLVAETAFETEKTPCVVQEPMVEQEVCRMELQPIAPELTFTNEEQTEVYFGSMEIQMPQGWTVESRVNAEGQTECVLIDRHKEHDFFYEHEIEIAAYSVAEMPKSQIQVMADLMDYFGFAYAVCKMEPETAPADNQWLLSVRDWEKEYDYDCILSKAPEGNWEIFLVQECQYSTFSDDVESFSDMVEQRDIWLNDGYRALEKSTVYDNDEYGVLNWDRSDALLIRSYRTQNGYNSLLYRKNQYRDAFDDLFFGQRNGVDGMDIMDINGDGYQDVIQDRWACYSDSDVNFQGYLWNTETQSFDHLNCTALMAQYGEVFSAKKEEYEDLVPLELLRYMSELVQQGQEVTESTLMQTDVSGNLSGEEVKQLAARSRDIKLDMVEIGAYFGEGTWDMVDADNDGIEDVLLEQYLGGSAGYVDFIFYKGDENGGFTKTHNMSMFSAQYEFVEWEGKIYPVWVNYDYNKKMFRGVSVACYREGECADWRYVWLQQGEGADSYENEITYLAAEKYRPLAEALLEFDVSYEEKTYERENHMVGTAESYEDYSGTCKSDLNNDGIAERYSKWVFFPSNMGTRQWLVFFLEDASEERMESSNRITEIIESEKGYAMLLWVDETEFGNVTYVLYEDELYDFHISTFLIEKESYVKLSEVKFTFGLEVEITQR